MSHMPLICKTAPIKKYLTFSIHFILACYISLQEYFYSYNQPPPQATVQFCNVINHKRFIRRERGGARKAKEEGSVYFKYHIVFYKLFPCIFYVPDKSFMVNNVAELHSCLRRRLSYNKQFTEFECWKKSSNGYCWANISCNVFRIIQSFVLSFGDTHGKTIQFASYEN